jgi:hypothetical protein
MILYLFGQKFSIYGYPVIERSVTRAYALDEKSNIYVLIWRTGEEPKQGNVSIVRIEKPTR